MVLLIVAAVHVEASDRHDDNDGRSRRGTPAVFRLEEASIADIRDAFDAGALTCRQLVRLYLNRIRAYDQSDPSEVPDRARIAGPGDPPAVLAIWRHPELRRWYEWQDGPLEGYRRRADGS